VIAQTPDAARYARLDAEFSALQRIHPDQRTAEQAARGAAVLAELLEIVATPPPGYGLPALAAGLVAHAEAHGWQTLVQWTRPDYDGEPFVTVQVGRALTAEEREHHHGDRWTYRLTWHSRGCPPGRVRLFGQGSAITPDEPSGRSPAPSVKAVRAVIEAHPAPRRLT
jgi:hypothetical protein